MTKSKLETKKAQKTPLCIGGTTLNRDALRYMRGIPHGLEPATPTTKIRLGLAWWELRNGGVHEARYEQVEDGV